jgi:hypothetical protein
MASEAPTVCVVCGHAPTETRYTTVDCMNPNCAVAGCHQTGYRTAQAAYAAWSARQSRSCVLEEIRDTLDNLDCSDPVDVETSLQHARTLLTCYQKMRRKA